MHSGYNKNENEAIKAEVGEEAKTLVGNWQEERALLEMAGHSRMPPDKRGFPGPKRTLLHRATEEPADWRSTLRSSFVNPQSHDSYFPLEGNSVRTIRTGPAPGFLCDSLC